MHHIEIKNLGPIEYCSMDVNDFMVFTGPQASGKSTIAKAIYLFRSLKSLILEKALQQIFSKNLDDLSFRNILANILNEQYISLFSDAYGTSQIRYTFSIEHDIHFNFTASSGRMRLKCSPFFNSKFDLIDRIVKENQNQDTIDYQLAMQYFNEAEVRTARPVTNTKEILSIILNQIFFDEYDCIYIPAGRSIITTLTDHLAYIFTSMDDRRKSSIDYCTRMYVEQVLMLKPVFASEPNKLINKQKDNNHKELLEKVSTQMQMVLNGYYLNKGAEESIVVDNEYSVKLNYASSGQQETVWLFNILFYYLMEQKNVFIVIEEPESHLFPEAQKSIVELIGLFSKQGQNQVLLTTHSPYILGAVNNLLYASQLDKAGKDISGIFDKDMLISNDILSSYFIADGKAVDCMDSELQLIEQSVIDGASEKINDDYERLFRLQDENREDR